MKGVNKQESAVSHSSQKKLVPAMKVELTDRVRGVS